MRQLVPGSRIFLFICYQFVCMLILASLCFLHIVIMVILIIKYYDDYVYYVLHIPPG